MVVVFLSINQSINTTNFNGLNVEQDQDPHHGRRLPNNQSINTTNLNGLKGQCHDIAF
jgi:hypothetical protein